MDRQERTTSEQEILHLDRDIDQHIVGQLRVANPPFVDRLVLLSGSHYLEMIQTCNEQCIHEQYGIHQQRQGQCVRNDKYILFEQGTM